MGCSQESLKNFANFIERELGIVYDDHNYFQLQNRLEEIAKVVGVKKVDELCELFKQGGLEKYRQLLLDMATNNETSFFRDPRVFEGVEKMVIKQAVDNYRDLRIWSAACSTGQEPVSLGILLKEFSRKTNANFSFSITATDISERVLTKAKSGTYTQLEVNRGLTDELLQNYFSREEGDKWKVNDDISRNISFQKLNLKESYPFTQKFHVIFCRNVLIYQKVDAKREILKKITSFLEGGGHLILGSGESLLGISDDYDQVFSETAVMYRKKVS